MGIGATKSKRTHPHHGRPLGIGERLQSGLHLQLEGSEINRWVGLPAMEARRQLPLRYTQGRLDQAGDAGGGF